MRDDSDVRALQALLTKGWRYLAEPSLTRHQRQEMRNQMKRTEEALRAALARADMRDRAVLTPLKPRARPLTRLNLLSEIFELG